MKNKNEKGFALVLSLVLMIVMSLMGGALIIISSGDHASNNESDNYQQTFYVAETGLLEGERALLNEYMGPLQSGGTRDRTKGKYHNEGTGLQPHSGLTKSYPTKNKRSVWSVTNKPYKDAHFAVYPPDLIEPCIKAGSEVGDIVLDPFMGSGTTAMVAKALGRDYIGCELHEDYGNLIQKRVQDYVPVKEETQEGCINILDII